MNTNRPKPSPSGQPAPTAPGAGVLRRPIRVLIIDDSVLVRRTLSNALSALPDMEVVGMAADAFEGRDKIIEVDPDVITLDIEMPRVDGLSFLERIMQNHPMRVVIHSTLGVKGSGIALRALELGAVDVVQKPSCPTEVPAVHKQMIHSIRSAARIRLKRSAPTSASAPASKPSTVPLDTRHLTSTIVAIGASTGGTTAIKALLQQLPARIPPMVIVQHMPEHFTAAFAASLNASCPMEVQEARGRDPLRPGLALLAPGGKHMVLASHPGIGLRVELTDTAPVHHQKPAVDILFDSVAAIAGRRTVATVLTGMGADGAAGLLAIRKAGGRTLAQDEASSVVYGMPREAAENGAAQKIVPLASMGAAMMQAIQRG
jgi:two-component system, chemotaxis family, protein-glutamate methylesterase/glutaminase